MPSLPPYIISVFLPFASIFFRSKTWSKALLLITGALLCRGGRTVCAVLRVLGMKGEKHFDKYHRVLSRDKWDPLKGSKILLNMLVEENTEPVVIAIDEHIERRTGRKIKAKGCYRDAVRSSRNFIVRCFGLKWITVMVIKNLSWTSRSLALPFLTVLAPSASADKKKGKTHKTTTDWAIQIMMQIRRWLPGRKIIFTADGGFATADLAWECRKHDVSLVTRLRIDARLFDFPKLKTGPGRPAKKGKRLFNPKKMFEVSDVPWSKSEVKWYEGGVKKIEYITIICLWHVTGYEPVPIRLVLLRDPEGKYQSVALMSSDVTLTPITIIESFVSRWNQEVTHREVRDYLGVETQRQWSDLAIARTTPVLFGLYSLVVLIADKLPGFGELQIQQTAWYRKRDLTFSDALREVRRHLWRVNYFKISGGKVDPQEIISEEVVSSLIDQLAEVV